ncbi:MAG: glycosyltransferase family 2 protein [Oligoflexia bacterium]|nr:glycosyltransferase family 2 protein [Oligoflexia bacterium]
MNRTPITAAIITKNEERHIRRCLESLLWVDEILVVDAESDDQTAAICQDPSAPWASKLRFLRRPWTGFRDQRNFSLEQARHDWVLVVDADEKCSEELAARLQSLLAQAEGPCCRAYKVRRTEYFLGKPIHYGIWNPSYQDRFFHRTGVRYVNDIHEYPLFPVAPQRIHEPLIHSPEFHPDLFLYKMNKYTTIEAGDRIRQGQRTNPFRILFAFPAMFLKNYFYYGAYKDGMHGFIISILEGVSRAVRHVKMWQLSRPETLAQTLAARKGSTQ